MLAHLEPGPGFPAGPSRPLQRRGAVTAFRHAGQSPRPRASAPACQGWREGTSHTSRYLLLRPHLPPTRRPRPVGPAARLLVCLTLQTILKMSKSLPTLQRYARPLHGSRPASCLPYEKPVDGGLQ